ncbi:MAG: transposase [Thermoanaerobaculia bacterium]
MTRPLRLEFADALWHVTARGNGRTDIFKDDVDRTLFLEILGRTVELYRWRLHAWVLLGNHYHLLLETPEPTLSRGMRDLNGIFTQAVNRRHGRVGHLFQGRFNAILVEKESHLLELIRYVVLNPVRAGLAKNAAGWKWSNYQSTAGLVPAPEWLDTEWTLAQFGKRRQKAIESYRAFVAEKEGLAYDPWGQLVGRIFLGSERFREEMNSLIKSREASSGVTGTHLRPVRVPTATLIAEIERDEKATLAGLNQHPRLHIVARRRVALRLRREGLLSLAEIAALLDVGESQVSALVRGGDEAEAKKK